LNEVSSLHNFAWSPDGSKIAYRSDTLSYIYYPLMVYDARTKTKTELIDLDFGSLEGQSITWSPDGKQIAYVLKGRVYAYHLENKQPRLLFNIMERYTDLLSLRWSPDGKRFLYALDKAGIGEARIVNIDGSNDQLVFEYKTAFSASSAEWVGNDYFVSEDNPSGDFTAVIIEIATGKKETLASIKTRGFAMDNFAVFPDAQYIAGTNSLDASIVIYTTSDLRQVGRFPAKDAGSFIYAMAWRPMPYPQDTTR
jgi:WD40 repeat protein